MYSVHVLYAPSGTTDSLVHLWICQPQHAHTHWPTDWQRCQAQGILVPPREECLPRYEKDHVNWICNGTWLEWATFWSKGLKVYIYTCNYCMSYTVHVHVSWQRIHVHVCYTITCTLYMYMTTCHVKVTLVLCHRTRVQGTRLAIVSQTWGEKPLSVQK